MSSYLIPNFFYKAFFKEEFLTGINTPTGLSPHEKLAALHGYDIALLQEEQEFTILDAQAVLSVRIYLSGEEKIRVCLYTNLIMVSNNQFAIGDGARSSRFHI